jgi:hypothetical protein
MLKWQKNQKNQKNQVGMFVKLENSSSKYTAFCNETKRKMKYEFNDIRY